MIFTTLSYNGTEKALADWNNLSAASYSWTSQIGETFDCTMEVLADVADPFPVDAKITVYTGRTVPVGSLPLSGQPPVGLVNVFSGGQVAFVGYLEKRGKRYASGTKEYIEFHFVDMFTFCFGLLTFRKPRQSWNGTAQTVVNDPEVILGFSANANFTGNNYLSVRQQLCEIAQWVIAKATLKFGAAQFQFDALTTVIDGANYDLLVPPGTPPTPATANTNIPDYVPGTYGAIGASGPSLGTCINPNGLVLRPAIDGVNNINCAEAWRRALRALGGPGNVATWFDYSTSPPSLKVFTRDGLTPVTLPFTGSPSASDIQPCDELVPAAVDLMYHVISTTGGATYMQAVRDIAGIVSGALVEGIGTPGALTKLDGVTALGSVTENALTALGEGIGGIGSTVDIDGGAESGTTTSATISCVALSLGDPFGQGPTGVDRLCWEALERSFKTVLAPSNNTTLKLIGSVAVTDPGTGSTVSLSPYSYVLLNGGVASWMTIPHTSTTGIQAKVLITATFSYEEGNGNNCLSKTYQLDAIVTNLPGDTYTTVNITEFSAGELPPYGLAGFMFNLLSVLQYRGSHTITEQDVSPPFRPGNCLNLSNGRPEWLTMNAYVHAISYNFKSGASRLTFGPHSTLSAQQLMDNIRRDRGPRGVLFYNSNILNAAS